MKKFINQQPFGIDFRYRHQVDDKNNQRHAPFFLDRTWATKFWPDCNFAWYIDVSEVNTYLASDHIQNDAVVQPSLYCCTALENIVPYEYS